MRMEKFETCSEYLDSIGVDILEVGCKWHEKAPATMAENVSAVGGLFILFGSVALFCVLLELGDRYLKQP